MAASVIQLGYYALIDVSNPLKPITAIGYRATPFTINTPERLFAIQADPNQVWVDGNPANAQVRTYFEAFLRTLVGFGVNLTGNPGIFDLYSEMEAGDVLGDFAKIQIVDFMAFTGALDVLQTLPNGEQINLLQIRAGVKRPNINDLTRGDNEVMFTTIDHIGLHGLLPYLYAGGGITIGELIKCIKEWKPDIEERKSYVLGKLIPLLRQIGTAILPQKTIDLFFL